MDRVIVVTKETERVRKPQDEEPDFVAVLCCLVFPACVVVLFEQNGIKPDRYWGFWLVLATLIGMRVVYCVVKTIRKWFS